jgi:site-specific DNA recombinase
MARAPKTDPKRAVAYLRCSTNGQSTDQQRAALEVWAASAGVRIVTWCLDVGVSGTLPVAERAGLCEALASLREHRAGVLVAATRDRLARGVGNAAILEQLVRDAGAAVHTLDGRSSDETIEGRLLRQILDAFSEFEAAKIAVRTRTAHATRKAKGLLASGPPYGFRSEGESPHKRLVPIEHEQRALERMRALRAAGATQSAIARTLTEDGFKPRGRKWNVTTVARSLRGTSQAQFA